MARDAYEKAHDAAETYVSSYTEQKDYSGDEPRRGHRVNDALDELKRQVDEAVAERDAADTGDTADEGTGGTADQPTA